MTTKISRDKGLFFLLLCEEVSWIVTGCYLAHFQLTSPFRPSGDQPQAIRFLLDSLAQGHKDQVLLGVTGSGKTFTIANIIAETGRPTLILSPNKTLAAQMYSEMKEFFPNNAVEYFVSYYDYYKPEAYVPRTDTYIEKVASINDDIDRMRHSATRALLERRDVVIVASVSCIYGIGSPELYSDLSFSLAVGESIAEHDLFLKLTSLQYQRNDVFLQRVPSVLRGIPWRFFLLTTVTALGD